MAPNTALAQDNTMIVFDASGSMWGQIDGRAKIEIARDVLGDVLGNVPRENSLGMMVYGHRRKGDCTDIELVVEAATDTAPAMANFVNLIKPKGKTPLSEAVKQAAEALRYTEDKATVVLITDGIETCDADPCALARQLENSGVDFTTHVVGFGLTKDEGAQVACLAEVTGGRYFDASDAGALSDALTQTVAVVVPAPVPKPVTEPEPVVLPYNLKLSASLMAGGPLLQDPEAKWTLTHRETGEKSRFNGSTQEITLGAGAYDVALHLAGWEFTGEVMVTTDNAADLHLDLNMGILTVNVVEGADKRPSDERFHVRGADNSGGRENNDTFYFPAGAITLSTSKGNYVSMEKEIILIAGDTQIHELNLQFGTATPAVRWVKDGPAVDGRAMVKFASAITGKHVAQTLAGDAQFIPAGQFVAHTSLGLAEVEMPFTMPADGEMAPVLVLNAARIAFDITSLSDSGVSVDRWAVLDGEGNVLFSSSRDSANEVLVAGTYAVELRLSDETKTQTPFTVTAGVSATIKAAP